MVLERGARRTRNRILRAVRANCRYVAGHRLAPVVLWRGNEHRPQLFGQMARPTSPAPRGGLLGRRKGPRSCSHVWKTTSRDLPFTQFAFGVRLEKVCR